MSIHDRLLVALTRARRDGGASMLADREALCASLLRAVPDLPGEARALAWAVAGGAAARIAAAADREAEQRAIAGEIAAAAGLPLAQVTPAVEIAYLGDVPIGEIGPEPPAERQRSQATDRVTAGDTFAPGLHHGGQVADPLSWLSPTQSRPRWQNPLVIAGVALFVAIGAGVAIDRTLVAREPSVTPELGLPLPPEQIDAAALPPGGPDLSGDFAKLPTLAGQRTPGGNFAFGFGAGSRWGHLDALLVLPAGGWEAGGTSLVARGTGSTRQSAGAGSFRLAAVNNAPVRTLALDWRVDGLDLADTCFAMIGQPGQPDVALSGATMCLMDSGCQHPVACAHIM